MTHPKFFDASTRTKAEIEKTKELMEKGYTAIVFEKQLEQERVFVNGAYPSHIPTPKFERPIYDPRKASPLVKAKSK